MKNTLLKQIFALFFVLISCVQGAFALIDSEEDIYERVEKINAIVETDFMSFINKSDLVGYRLAGFEMAVANYKNNAKMNAESLNTTINQIYEISLSTEISDTDKNLQIANLYQGVATMMYNMDNTTMNFILGLNQVMPSLTYSNFVRRYLKFYNELELTDAELKYKY